MPRTKGGIVTRRQHKKIIKMAKGHRGGRHKTFRLANESVMHALGTPTSTGAIGRGLPAAVDTAHQRGRASRTLSYSRLMHGLSVAGVDVDRKILADLAVRDDEAFGKIAETAKAAVAS